MTNDQILMTNKAPNLNDQNDIFVWDLRNWDLPHTNPLLRSGWPRTNSHCVRIMRGEYCKHTKDVRYTCPVLKFEEFVVPGFEYWGLGFGIFEKIMVEAKKENLITRPPVVVVLGHVDHGKSSILEALKKNVRITEKEAGGITQHIGAYEVEYKGKKITFIDTPGHEAFSAMRSRGAKVADIAVLTIAAEEGVKTQTKEAISHINKTELPFIIALNKIDKPESNPEKVARELSEQKVLVESLGGKVPLVKISAKTGQNMEELLDLILLVAEMEELRGDINKTAEGVVIEAYLDNLRGPTATLLIRDGILKTGDVAGTGSTLGKIKILEDFQGKPINKAFPSMPVVALGFEKVPSIGEKFKIFSDSESAKRGAGEEGREAEGAQVFSSEPGKKVLNLILKTDVLGSLEAITELLKNLPQEKVTVRILKGEVGDINETDLKLAKSAKAKILGFRVKVNLRAKMLSEKEKIKIMNFEIIYELSQVVRQMMEKILEPEIERKEMGKVKILAIFPAAKNRQVIGGRILEGKIKKGLVIDVLRPASPGERASRGGDEEIIGKGKLINLQKDKKDVEECGVRDECGILYEGTGKIEEGDTLEVYTQERRKGEL